MTHAPFIIGSYALGVLLPAAYGIAAWRRMRLAARRLLATESLAGRRTRRRGQ